MTEEEKSLLKEVYFDSRRIHDGVNLMMGRDTFDKDICTVLAKTADDISAKLRQTTAGKDDAAVHWLAQRDLIKEIEEAMNQAVKKGPNMNAYIQLRQFIKAKIKFIEAKTKEV